MYKSAWSHQLLHFIHVVFSDMRNCGNAFRKKYFMKVDAFKLKRPENSPKSSSTRERKKKTVSSALIFAATSASRITCRWSFIDFSRHFCLTKSTNHLAADLNRTSKIILPKSESFYFFNDLNCYCRKEGNFFLE